MKSDLARARENLRVEAERIFGELRYMDPAIAMKLGSLTDCRNATVLNTVTDILAQTVRREV